jgi:hypothetical protein
MLYSSDKLFHVSIVRLIEHSSSASIAHEWLMYRNLIYGVIDASMTRRAFILDSEYLFEPDKVTRLAGHGVIITQSSISSVVLISPFAK